MIFAAPIVGRVLAACAASQARASASSADSVTAAIPQIGGGEAANTAVFAQTLDNVEQAAAPKPPHAAIPMV
jgi:hypothetical protein